MGILIITPAFRPNIGGVERYLDDLCEYLLSKNYTIYVITYQPITTKARGLSFEKKDNLEIRRVSWFGHNLFHKFEHYPILEFIYITPFLFISTLLFLLKYNKKVDVIHAQGLNAAFIANILGKIFKKRIIMSTCAVYNFKPRTFFAKVSRRILSGFDKILPLANFSKRELLDIGLPEKKMKTYYLWVDQEAYRPEDKRESKKVLNLNGKFIVLYVGRFIEIKGINLLIEIAKRVDKNIHFVFIGDDGPLLKVIEKEAFQSANIILIKGIQGEQLIPYYRAADILVVPSLYEEAFGKVIIEALSCGTPVIGANKGAIPDILNSSVGKIISPTIDNIKNEIEYFYSHPDSLAKLTDSCRNYAERYFSKVNAEIIEKSYYS